MGQSDKCEEELGWLRGQGETWALGFVTRSSPSHGKVRRQSVPSGGISWCCGESTSQEGLRARETEIGKDFWEPETKAEFSSYKQ